MKVNRAISLELETFDKVLEVMKQTGSNNFSRTINILVKLGYAQLQKQISSSTSSTTRE